MNKPGYITLLSVLVLGAIFTTTAMFILNNGLNLNLNSWYWQQELKSRAAARSCLEVALQEVRNSTPYTGSDSLTFDSSSCSYTVNSLGGQEREIYATGLNIDSVSKIRVVVDTINPDINITHWEEKVDF